MKPLLVLSAAVLASAGLAAHSATRSDSLWTPACPGINCIEPEVEDHIPVGAEMSFSQCRESDGAHFSYSFVREEAGWKLVSRKAVLRGDCGTEAV